MTEATGKGTPDDPWTLETPPGTADYKPRGRFGMYVPPVMEALGRMRAKSP